MEPDYFFLTRHNFGIFVRAFNNKAIKNSNNNWTKEQNWEGTEGYSSYMYLVLLELEVT